MRRTNLVASIFEIFLVILCISLFWQEANPNSVADKVNVERLCTVCHMFERATTSLQLLRYRHTPTFAYTSNFSPYSRQPTTLYPRESVLSPSPLSPRSLSNLDSRQAVIPRYELKKKTCIDVYISRKPNEEQSPGFDGTLRPENYPPSTYIMRPRAMDEESSVRSRVVIVVVRRHNK